MTPKSQIRSCHFSTLNSLIASPFIIKLKIPALVYQVLYDLTPGPLSHLITHYLCSADCSSALLGSCLVLWYVGNMFFDLNGKCCSLDTFWRLPKCRFLHKATPNTLPTAAPLSSCLLVLQQHSSPAGITQLERHWVNNGLEFSKWTTEEEHSEERGGSMCCKSECP